MTTTTKDQVANRIEVAMLSASHLPPSRARSMVQTKLDEAMLWLSLVPDVNQEAPDT